MRLAVVSRSLGSHFANFAFATQFIGGLTALAGDVDPVALAEHWIIDNFGAKLLDPKNVETLLLVDAQWQVGTPPVSKLGLLGYLCQGLRHHRFQTNLTAICSNICPECCFLVLVKSLELLHEFRVPGTPG